MPVPQTLVTRYFQLLVGRQFTEAERELERLKQKMQRTEWNRGYYRALKGIYLSRKSSNDNYSFLSKLDFTDKPALHEYRREFFDETHSSLHADFDRGFFSAWADCMRVISRMEIEAPAPKVKAPAKAAQKDEEAPLLETTKDDKSQVTMANFVKKKAKA
ncbi:MAG: hypothetical protein NWF04_03495 [Candidatus Bathyarchaeota archaeon]|nr:hypothetical protein [Candidatus Bathyarchaeota archaeon]